ncbi:MAG TPA: hypothetical protein VG944_09925, partial [Fimbriimonas sp.]|nr:hypothetical protein [Fimbriimonas sp.]
MLLAALVWLLPCFASAQHLTAASFNPSTVASGGTTQCTVRISQAAGAGGFPVQISAPQAFITAPPSISIPFGATSTTFSVPIGNVSSNKAATVGFSDGTINLHANLIVMAPVQVSTVSVSPSSVTCGSSATGAVHLTNPAPSGGFDVTLSSSQPFVHVPASVKVSSGRQDATFPLTTTTVNATKSSTITASDANASVKTGLQVVQKPSILSVRLTNSRVLAGSFVTGTINLDEVAPAGGTTVQMSSD